MDPDQALKELRTALQLLSLEPSEENADLVINSFTALDGWLKNGGFPPKDWKRDD